MSAPTEITADAVREVLATVNDPELHRDLVSLGMVAQVDIDGSRIGVEVELTTPACPLKSEIGAEVTRALVERWPQADVEVRFGARVRQSGRSGKGDKAAIEGVRNVILVASGKGGVGKSTVAVNLAYALQRSGAAVGLADTDVYGPSLHLMTHPGDLPRPSGDGQRMQPPLAHGVPVVSMGQLVEPGQAVVWRGPMLAKAALQLLVDVDWGALDYLVVDLPPGTGDVQLSIAQKVQVAGAVVVSTPQAVALADVVRAKAMFDTVGIETLGLIENMSYFICDGCQKKHTIFSSGGGERTAAELGIPFLGGLPLDPALRQGCDDGEPLVVAQPDCATAACFMDIAGKVAARVAVLASTLGGSSPHLRIVQ